MTTVAVPSWKRWPPNCCESCVGWEKTDRYIDYKSGERVEHYSDVVGICHRDNSIDFGTMTDSRYRCPAFQRKEGI